MLKSLERVIYHRTNATILTLEHTESGINTGDIRVTGALLRTTQ